MRKFLSRICEGEAAGELAECPRSLPTSFFVMHHEHNMNLTDFEKIAKYLAVPLVLVGFVLMLAFGIHTKLIDSGLLPQVSQQESGVIIKLMLNYGFQLGLCVTVLGFGLAAWNKYMDKVPAVDAGKLAVKLLQGQLQAKDEQIKALTEAIAALSKTDAPASSINKALQALQRGNTEQAQAIFAEIAAAKEAAGKKNNQEAAEAYRHLGALAYMNNPKEALAAYRKATELAPDNADSWNQLGTLLLRTGELVQAEATFRKVLALGEAHQDNKEQVWAYGNLGIVYRTRGELDKAEEMYRKGFEIDQALDSKKVMAATYSNLGLMYNTRGDLDNAEEMHRKSLAIHQALGRKEDMAADYTNLGNVYATCGELDKAEEMYRKGLEIDQALGRKEGMATKYGNIGVMAYTRGELDKAEEMYRKALELHQALDSKEGIANQYGNLGLVYAIRGDLAQAEQMHRNALEFNEALGRKEGMAANYTNLGIVYEKRGNLDQAEAAWKQSLSLHQEMGASQHPNAKMIQQWLDELAQPKLAAAGKALSF